jgi:glycosyltransferase involved in cell wall biosynthesis
MTQFARSTLPVTIGLPFSDQPVPQFEAAVRSVFAQTHRHWALILVADGASPENLDLARSISDPRAHVEVFRERGGLARRLNDIAAMAETSFLFRMDADDVMHPERVVRQLSVLDSGTADLVGSRAYLIDGTDRIYGLMKEPPGVPPTSQKYLGSRVIFIHPTIAAPTEWFRTHAYDESLLRAQDKALFISAASSTRMVKIPDPLLFYRVARPIPPSRQAETYKFGRIVVRKYGHMVASRPTVLGYIVRSEVKQRMFQIMSNTWGQDYLFERKIDPLDAESLGQAERALRSALASPVPGWPVPEKGVCP